MTIRVLLVDDHPAVMEGTKLILEQDGDIAVQLAHDGEEALTMLESEHFDVMLFDMHMPDMSGIDLSKRVLRISPDAAILIFTGFEFANHFNLMVDAGVSGFLCKTATKEQLVTAVRAALRKEVVLPLSLVKQLRRTHLPDHHAEIQDGLITATESEILEYISKGKSNKEIAEMLHMSQRSLEYSLTNLFHRLHVKSRIEAVMKARSMGILSSPD